MGNTLKMKKRITGVIAIMLTLTITGCNFKLGNKNSSSSYSWEDYSIDASDLAVSIEADQTDSIDSITLYGVGDLNVTFPCSTGLDIDKKGETIYDWSVNFENYKVSLFYKYEKKKFSLKSNDGIEPKDMKASIILKDGSESGDIQFEIKDNAICFYDVSLPGKADCLKGVDKVTAECNIGSSHFISEDLPISINGKVSSGSDNEDFDSLLADLEITQVADARDNDSDNDSNQSSEQNNNDKENNNSDEKEPIEEDANETTESGDSTSETSGGKEFQPGQLFSPKGWNISCIYGKFQATPQTDFDKEFFESDGAATVEIKRDGTYTLTCLSGGDEWTCSGKVTVVDKENEMDDIVVYLHDAVNSSGQKVKAKFVFTDAEDYPIFETEGFGYMGGNGAPYWFERVQ